MQRRTEWMIAAATIILGLGLRLKEAAESYLNPDEIQYVFLALPGSLHAMLRGVGHDTAHPPLLFFLLHPIAVRTSSEIVLRLIPVVAGAVFPFVAYRWLSRAWNPGAGLIALFVLTFSPNLIALSAQIRGYTLELLLAAVTLLFLESALERDSLWRMALFGLSLDLAILSEYSAAYFAGAVGIYFLLRAWDRKVSPRLWAAWAVGQASVLAIYAALYPIAIRPQIGVKHAFLRGEFPQAHQNLLFFSALATLKQFAYDFSSILAGAAAAVLFGAALALLWRRSSFLSRPGLSGLSQSGGRALAALLAAPFFFACAAGLLRVHPYGRSRHTVILALFVAAGVSIVLERVLRSSPRIAAIGALGLGLIWMLGADPDQNNIPAARDHRSSMITAIRSVQASIPPGSVILADEETFRYLRFYAADRRDWVLPEDNFKTQGLPVFGSLVTWRRWDFGEVDDFLEDLRSARDQFGLNRNAPVWIVDGGFDADIDGRLRQRFPGIDLAGLHNFDGALTVFETPPGM